MKLDPTVMRTMNRQDYRVLEAVEKGMKNRSLVPSSLIASIANLRHGGCHKIISSLHRDNLLAHDQSCGYDGYRVTNSGYDILALWNLKCRGFISALGDQIGVGKESDVYLAASPKGKQLVLKFHRLGRTSFRDVKKKRDYFMINSMKKGKTGKHGTTLSGQDQPNSWLFLSKISAMKEYTFMKALNDVGYPTPTPITHNRHVVAMGLIRGLPLYQLHKDRVTPDQAESIFSQSMDICKQLARNGLVHCDLNEYNLLVDLSGGAQTSAKDDHEEDAADPYVRHSGSSATVVTRGDLNVPDGLPGKMQHTTYDGTGEIVTEQAPKPKELLENGVDAKPIVTLIDFPQMISVRHPNAQELWERDIECLKRFFVMKLGCLMNEEDWEQLIPAWDDLIANVNEDEIDIDDGLCNDEDDEESKLGSDSVLSISSNSCLASKKQLRLDHALKASGFSREDAERGVELHYFKDSDGGIVPVDEEDEEGGSSEENNGESEEKVEEYDGEISDKEDDDDDELGEVRVFRQNDDDNVSTAAFSTTSTVMTNAQAEAIAKVRVQRHLQEMKRGKARKQAFRRKNSNKTFVKGKRVFQDFTV